MPPSLPLQHHTQVVVNAAKTADIYRRRKMPRQRMLASLPSHCERTAPIRPPAPLHLASCRGCYRQPLDRSRCHRLIASLQDFNCLLVRSDRKLRIRLLSMKCPVVTVSQCEVVSVLRLSWLEVHQPLLNTQRLVIALVQLRTGSCRAQKKLKLVNVTARLRSVSSSSGRSESISR